MAEMGKGYGSECHLLRYSGRHRDLLDHKVMECVGAEAIRWLDFHFDRSRTWPDSELKGLDFLDLNSQVRSSWSNFWPQRGEQPNWDAVAKIRVEGGDEWLLVEAKANLQELGSLCKAKEGGGREKIQEALGQTKEKLGVPQDRNRMSGYYQYCNRIAILQFLTDSEVGARLLNIYFIGDRSDKRRTCPRNREGWKREIERRSQHVGLPPNHSISTRIHELFLDVCPKDAK